jgi:hypothetical protein
MPDYPIPLLGWGSLSKLGIQITFEAMGHATLEINPGSAERDSIVMAVLMPREEWRLYCTRDESLKPLQLCKDFPLIWAENSPPGLAHKRPPIIVIDPMLGASLQRQRQYLVSLEPSNGIQTHLTRLKEAGILMECQSPWNISASKEARWGM